jgi:hypothetical protein
VRKTLYEVRTCETIGPKREGCQAVVREGRDAAVQLHGRTHQAVSKRELSARLFTCRYSH